MRINSLVLIILLWLLPCQAWATATGQDYVILLHGIARSSAHMEDMAEYLSAEGYEVYNLDYPSTDHKLEDLIDLTQAQIDALNLDDTRTVHFVGYSMGGILVRGIVHKFPPVHLGRIVQLAPPNHGSEVADFLKDNRLYAAIYGPAGQQLTTKERLDRLFGEVNYELGIIAGNYSIDPISSTIIPGADDGKVSIESTRLKGMKDHIIVPATHTFFPDNSDVLRQTSYFLKHGHFHRQEN